MFYAAESGMNAPAKLLLALTAAATLSFAQPAKANLITNPGFETGDFTGWTQLNGNVVGTFAGVAPHSGNFQAGFGAPGGSLSQSVATTPGASYTVSFFLALVSAGQPEGSLSVSWGGVTLFSLTNQNGFGYTEYTFTETASTASTALQFQFSNPLLTDIWFVDDVSVNPAGVPDAGSTLPLLGFASLGLVALRRKLGC